MVDLLNTNRMGKKQKSRVYHICLQLQHFQLLMLLLRMLSNGIIFESIWLCRRISEDRIFIDDYSNCCICSTVTLCLSIYHLRLTCQQLRLRLNTERVCLCVGLMQKKEIRPNINIINETVKDLLSEG